MGGVWLGGRFGREREGGRRRGGGVGGWRRHTLITGCSIQHPKDLEDVAIAVVAMELIPRTVEAKDYLTRFAMMRT
jgi:hypothetical protein